MAMLNHAAGAKGWTELGFEYVSEGARECGKRLVMDKL